MTAHEYEDQVKRTAQALYEDAVGASFPLAWAELTPTEHVVWLRMARPAVDWCRRISAAQRDEISPDPLACPSSRSASRRRKAPTMSAGVDLIAAERRRQIEQEGWTPEHDAEHGQGELADAAALYIARVQYAQHGDHLSGWETPAHDWVKVTDRRQMLVKAGALIAAEIDRLDEVDRRIAERVGPLGHEERR